MSDYGTRTPGQRLWLLGAAALLAVLVVGGGWLGFRGLSRTTPPLIAAPPDTELQTPSEVVPVFGAPEVVDGVPWGFAVTPQGAVAAAVTTVAVTGQGEAVFDPARFDAVAAVVFTPDQADAQARQVELARAEFDASGWARQPPSRRTYFLTPLAARLVAYDHQAPSATVEVWAMTLVGVGDAGGAVFTTSTVELAVEPEADTWTVTRLDSVDGPTPLVAATASAPGRTRALLREALPAVPLPLSAGSS